MELLVSLVTKQDSMEVERARNSCFICLLSLACPSTGFVQAANATPGITHAYTAPMMLW